MSSSSSVDQKLTPQQISNALLSSAPSLPKLETIQYHYTTEWDVRVYRFACQLESAAANKIIFSHRAYDILVNPSHYPTTIKPITNKTAITLPTTEINLYDRLVLSLIKGSFAFARALLACRQVAQRNKHYQIASISDILRNQRMMTSFIELMCCIYEDLRDEEGKKWSSLPVVKSLEDKKKTLLFTFQMYQNRDSHLFHSSFRADKPYFQSISLFLSSKPLRFSFLNTIQHYTVADRPFHPLHRLLRLLADATFVQDEAFFAIKRDKSTIPQPSQPQPIIKSESESSSSSSIARNNILESLNQAKPQQSIEGKEVSLIDIPTDATPDDLVYHISGLLFQSLQACFNQLLSIQEYSQNSKTTAESTAIFEWILLNEDRLVLFVHMCSEYFAMTQAQGVNTRVKRPIQNKITDTFNDITIWFALQFNPHIDIEAWKAAASSVCPC